MNATHFKQGHSIKFKLEEAEGVVEMSGWIKSATDEHLTIQHSEGGVATIPMAEVIKPVVGKKKVNVKDRTIARPVAEKEPKKYSAAAKAPKAGSKQAIVVDIYTKHCDTKSRKEIIEIICDTVGMTAAGASTYYQNAKKWVSSNKES